MAVATEDSNIGSEVQVPYVNGLVICAFLSIAWYNVAELTVLIQSFFKRYAGFYYYSLLVATWGIFFHGLGMFLKFYHINESMAGDNIANTVIVWVGWCMMVTGQSIVLYSRLHLVANAPWTRWILVMICIDGVVLHLSTGVLTFLTNCTNDPERWIPAYSVVEKIQVTCFFLQEVVLSSIYIWKTAAMLRQEGPIFNSKKNARGSRGRKVLVHTIVMSVIIICLDITLLGLEFAGLYDIQTSFKGAVYSVKLKMEFTILNQLMNLVRGNLREDYSSRSPHTNTITSSSKPHNFSRHGGGVRSVHRNSELGHSAGAYARMDEDGTGGRGIKLQNLKAGDVLKTTTTEVRVDRIEKIEEESERRVDNCGATSRASQSSSEVYIIEQHDKGAV
ncbi:hypothetical protein K458DRAFT_388047 [Lentithecium fluviatile CBS 122367]|uniref:DUF7703 domain-containing protein n=1 Tax=Lentithecium fluviatile CBS 122367 TaxID=1168545 RepID=A0A6G1J3R1_9PLEO|nr:hypothetical protein K458DRAFT_388047 [Lentithecium fluviatile CBS 122367]